MSENDEILDQSINDNNKAAEEIINNKKEKKKEKKKDDTITFTSEEMDAFDQVEKELNIDEVNQSDLEDPNAFPELPNLSTEDLQEIIKDPKNRALLKDETSNPTIYDTLKSTDEIKGMKPEEIAKLRKELATEKQNLMVFLGSQPTIKLHLRTGMMDGKNVWIEKEFPFNSLDKRQEFHLNILRARLNTLSIKYNIVGAKAPLTLTEEEVNFLTKSSIMIEVAGWRQAEKEALLKLGMAGEDFARVDTDQYKIALLSWAWRSQNVPYYKQGR